jgi:hypothetical protein
MWVVLQQGERMFSMAGEIPAGAGLLFRMGRRSLAGPRHTVYCFLCGQQTPYSKGCNGPFKKVQADGETSHFTTAGFLLHYW